MFRAAVRTTPRALRQPTALTTTARRFASTTPADKKYTWKGTATRWGLAVGALYWYNTSPIFADEAPSRISSEPPQFSESDLPTVDAIVEEKRRQLDAKLKAKEEQAATEAGAAKTAAPSQAPPAETDAAPGDGEKTPEQLEEEAGGQGAFNPETGEINWDCPCLGGMAHGPCGEEFKAAFSCFVYSNEEPKGMDCIDKFQNMQECFRQYPDVYGAEIADEEAAEAEAEAEAAAAAGSPTPAADSNNEVTSTPPAQQSAEQKPAESHEYTTQEHKVGPTDAPKGAHPVASTPTNERTAGEGVAQADAIHEDRGVPKSSFDATAANPGESK